MKNVAPVCLFVDKHTGVHRLISVSYNSERNKRFARFMQTNNSEVHSYERHTQDPTGAPKKILPPLAIVDFRLQIAVITSWEAKQAFDQFLSPICRAD
jgi:hypothetical protein